RRQSAVQEVESRPCSGVPHSPRVATGGGPGEFDAGHSSAQLSQAQDQAAGGVGLAGIHRASAGGDHSWTWGGGSGWQGIVRQAYWLAVGISERSENAEPAGLDDLLVVAFHDPAQTAHREEVACVSPDTSVPLELLGGISVAEHDGDQIPFV